MTGETRLFANLGAEEGSGWVRMSEHPRVRTVARLWAALFSSDARRVGPGVASAPRLAGPLERFAHEPALSCCSTGAVLVPWLATREAAELARAEGVALGVSEPEIALRVHDKAFAQSAAREAGFVPAALRGASLVLAPEDLVDADAVRCRIEDAVAHWPEGLRARFTVKPRIGTSGRGRLSGRDGRIDATRLATSLARLGACGGALVEPWLERTLDLSAQLFIAGPDEVRVLGTLRAMLTPHGVPVGHVGRIASDGSIDSGTRWDAELRDAAGAIGRAAARAGFRGVCGMDAFVFRDANGPETLRPVVELNARFTAGTIALGHVARALHVGLGSAARSFYFGFAPSDVGWDDDRNAAVDVLPILSDDSSARLCLAADARALDETLASTRRSA